MAAVAALPFVSAAGNGEEIRPASGPNAERIAQRREKIAPRHGEQRQYFIRRGGRGVVPAQQPPPEIDRRVHPQHEADARFRQLPLRARIAHELHGAHMGARHVRKHFEAQIEIAVGALFPNKLVRLKERDVFVRQMAERARRAPGIAQEAAEIVLREPAALRGEPCRVLPGVQAQNRRFAAGDAAHQLFAHGSRGGRIRVSLRRLEQRPRREDDAPRRVLRHASGTGVQPRERILFSRRVFHSLPPVSIDSL